MPAAFASPSLPVENALSSQVYCCRNFVAQTLSLVPVRGYSGEAHFVCIVKELANDSFEVVVLGLEDSQCICPPVCFNRQAVSAHLQSAND